MFVQPYNTQQVLIQIQQGRIPILFYQGVQILLYTVPMNLDRYVPILINMLDAIVSGGKMLSSSPLVVGYLLHSAGKYSIF